jgi:hypothetical protein
MGSRGRRLGAAAAVVACALAFAISLALFTGGGGKVAGGRRGPYRAANRQVLTALIAKAVSTTEASGSYDMTFSNVTTPPTSCGGNGGVATNGTGATPDTDPISCGGGLPSIDGHGTVDTDPYAMVVISQDSGLGTISLYDNGTDIWEFGGGNYGLGPGPDSPGAPLSGYAGSVEGTVGQEAGALDMQGLASAGGYLDIESQEIKGVTPAGTGTVDGVPVTIYKLYVTGIQDPDLSGLTSQEVATIQAADAVLRQTGFAGKAIWISVDADGFIRETRTEYSLSDGSTMTGDSTYSNFGCAGTVLMPGQQGNTAPPPGCVSPDTAGTAATPTTSTTTSTSTSGPTSTTSTTTSSIPSSTTSTTSASVSGATTTVPGSGTSTGQTITVTTGTG